MVSPMIEQHENGLGLSQADITTEWAFLCGEARELAQLQNKVNWQLADLCLKVRTSGQYGTGRMNDFAKEIDLSRSTVYSYAIQASFYDDPTARNLIDNAEFITYQKCNLIRKYTGDINVAITWLEATAFNGWFYDHLKLELDKAFKKIQPPPTPIADGIFHRSQLRDVVNRLPSGQYHARITPIKMED